MYIQHEGTVNSSFGAEDGLQQLQTVVDDSKKESASICEVSRTKMNGSLSMHKLGNALDESKGKDKGRTKARLGQTMR